MKTLTELQAFAAMVLFLKQYYRQTKSEDIAIMLSDLSLLSDGSTADPAAWEDWSGSVQEVLHAAQTDESWVRFEEEHLVMHLL